MDVSDGKYSFASFGEKLRELNKELGTHGEHDLAYIVNNPYFTNKKGEKNLPGTGKTGIDKISVNAKQTSDSLENLNNNLNNVTVGLNSFDAIILKLLRTIQAGRENFQDVLNMVEQVGTGRNPKPVTGLTGIAFPFKGDSLSQEFENNFYEEVLKYKNGESTDKLLGFNNEKERDAFLNKLYPTFRGKLANIGQNLIEIRSKESAFANIGSLEDFYSIYNKLTPEQQAEIDEKYWSSQSASLDDIRKKVIDAGLSLGNIDPSKAS